MNSAAAIESNEPTIPQDFITDSTTPHFKQQPEICKLIKMMLSFHSDQRPSCAFIIEAVEGFQELTHYRQLDANDCMEESSEIPICSEGWYFIKAYIG